MRIAIIVHVFYPRLWPEVAKCIRSFSEYEYDVFVTLPETAAEGFEQVVCREFSRTDVKRLPNRGFDVGPFVEVLHRIDLDRYDYVVKLHTKRNRFGVVNFMPLVGGQWRRKLLSFCRSPKDVGRCLELFAANPKVGMVGNGELIMQPWDELARNPEPRNEADHRAFVAGTMFMVRAKPMKMVRDQVAFEDFESTERQQTASMAHDWERKLGYMLVEKGYEIVAYPAKGFVYRLLRPCLALAYQLLFRN